MVVKTLSIKIQAMTPEKELTPIVQGFTYREVPQIYPAIGKIPVRANKLTFRECLLPDKKQELLAPVEAAITSILREHGLSVSSHLAQRVFFVDDDTYKDIWIASWKEYPPYEYRKRCSIGEFRTVRCINCTLDRWCFINLEEICYYSGDKNPDENLQYFVAEVLIKSIQYKEIWIPPKEVRLKNFTPEKMIKRDGLNFKGPAINWIDWLNNVDDGLTAYLANQVTEKIFGRSVIRYKTPFYRDFFKSAMEEHGLNLLMKAKFTKGGLNELSQSRKEKYPKLSKFLAKFEASTPDL